jgi:predicted 3-demethylubiquinone-9 3-methyltransferase (glyoxalase superfamily)
MKEKITSCIWYNDGAREAAALYCSAFADATVTAQSPIVTVIDVSGHSLTLLDGGPMFKPNPSISFYYICETSEEIDRIWKAFSKEGTVMMELNKYPWNERYGWLSDKFGVSWQFGLGKVSEVGQKIIPSLMFVGNQYGRVDEAIEHYSSIFKNSKVESIMRYGKDRASDQEGKVQYAQVKFYDQKFRLMESAGPHKFNFEEGMSLVINCEDQQEIDYYWNRLTEGGEESMCGWLKDKFGISWQVVPTVLAKLMNDPQKAGKAAKAFMKMRKLNIEEIVKASSA